MPQPKKTLTVKDLDGSVVKESEVETVEEALKDLAQEAANGDLPLPYVVSFPGPGDTVFDITIRDAESAQLISTKGFMF